MPETQTPSSVPDLLKLIAKYGKRSVLVSGVDASAASAPSGKVIIDLSGVEPLNEIDLTREKVAIGTGMDPFRAFIGGWK